MKTKSFERDRSGQVMLREQEVESRCPLQSRVHYSQCSSPQCHGDAHHRQSDKSARGWSKHSHGATLRIDGVAMLLLLFPPVAKHCVRLLLCRGQLKVCEGGHGCSGRDNEIFGHDALQLTPKWAITKHICL